MRGPAQAQAAGGGYRIIGPAQAGPAQAAGGGYRAQRKPRAIILYCIFGPAQAAGGGYRGGVVQFSRTRIIMAMI